MAQLDPRLPPHHGAVALSAANGFSWEPLSQYGEYSEQISYVFAREDGSQGRLLCSITVKDDGRAVPLHAGDAGRASEVLQSRLPE